jgi:hypothetical protein
MAGCWLYDLSLLDGTIVCAKSSTAVTTKLIERTLASASVSAKLKITSGAGGLRCDIAAGGSQVVAVPVHTSSYVSGILVSVSSRAPPICTQLRAACTIKLLVAAKSGASISARINTTSSCHLSATITGVTTVYGPWCYDLTIITNMVATVCTKLRNTVACYRSFDISEWGIVASAEADCTYADSLSLRRCTCYQYRVTDADGVVMLSNNVWFVGETAITQKLGTASASGLISEVRFSNSVTGRLHQSPLDNLLVTITASSIATASCTITSYLHHAILFDPSFFDPAFFDTVARLGAEITATYNPSIVTANLGATISSGFVSVTEGETVTICTNVGAAIASPLGGYAVQASPPTITNIFYRPGVMAHAANAVVCWTSPDCYSGFMPEYRVNGGVWYSGYWAIQTATEWAIPISASINACYHIRVKTAHGYSTKYITSPYAYSCTMVHQNATVSAKMGVAGASGLLISTTANVGASVDSRLRTVGTTRFLSTNTVSSPPTVVSFTLQSAGGLHTRLQLSPPLPDASYITVERSANGVWEGSFPYINSTSTITKSAALGNCYQVRVRSNAIYGFLWSPYAYSSVVTAICTTESHTVDVVLGQAVSAPTREIIFTSNVVSSVERTTVSSGLSVHIPTQAIVISSLMGTASSTHLLSDASEIPHNAFITERLGTASQSISPPLVGVYATAWARYYAPYYIDSASSCYFDGCWTKFDSPRYGEMMTTKYNNNNNYADYFVATLPEARLGVMKWGIPGSALDGKTVTGRFCTGLGLLEYTATANMYPRVELVYATRLTGIGARCWGVLAKGCTELKLFTEYSTGSVMLGNGTESRRYIADTRKLSFEIGADVLSVSGTTGLWISGATTGPDISAAGQGVWYCCAPWASIEYITSFNNVTTKIHAIERTPTRGGFFANANAGSTLPTYLRSLIPQRMLYLVNPKRWARDTKSARGWKKDLLNNTNWKRDSVPLAAWNKDDEHDLTP